MTVPTSNTVYQAAVINAPLAKVWHLIKLGEFSSWWGQLQSSGPGDKGVSQEADVFEWKFKDGTVLHVKQEEHSSIRHSISYSVIASEPALSYSSVISTITLSPVTTGESEGATYISWTGEWSSDADAGVVEDGKFKRREALADLAKAVAKA